MKGDNEIILDKKTKSGERVCFVSPTVYGYFNPTVGEAGGGAERQLYLLSDYLKHWFDVNFIVGDYGQNKTEEIEGVTLHRAHIPDPSRNDLRKLPSLISALRRASADVYIHRGTPKESAVLYSIVQALGKEWICNISNDENLLGRYENLPWFLQLLYRRSLQNARCVIAQTERQKELLKDRYSVESVVVPNGYPKSETNTSYSERENFLWVGRLDPDQKQPHRYIDIAENFPQYKFVLIGSTDYYDNYETKIEDRIEQLDNIEYYKNVKPDLIHQYYKNAIALINTSAYEGFPNTFLEAWREGTPVLGLNIDPTRFSSGRRIGIKVEDPEHLSNLLEKLATDEAHLKKLGESAKDYFEINFEISTVAKKYANAIVGDS